jgi:DNA-directed RNA polymerase beta subunit
MLSNSSYIGATSHLQRVSNPMSKETKNLPVRRLDASHIFFLCPCDSPEGSTVGLVVNLAISCTISRFVYPSIIIDALTDELTDIEGHDNLSDSYLLVLINGKPIGFAIPDEIIEAFQRARSRGEFDWGTGHGMCSIGLVDNTIQIWTDSGRLTRPVWTNGPAGHASWYDAISKGHAKMADPFELEFLGQHLWVNELDTSLILGITASTIPCLDYQPVPRSTFGCCMIKQSICQLGPTQYRSFEVSRGKSRSSCKHTRIILFSSRDSQRCTLLGEMKRHWWTLLPREYSKMINMHME